jgi:heme-degrading monooxygenase HmoA
MIARVWSAATSSANIEKYRDHFSGHVLPALERIDGFSGASLLERPHDAGVEIVVITRWRSLDAIRAFAGADIDRAVVAPDIASLLARYDHAVRHYDIVFDGR